ncbi:MAG: hypothetical protein ACI93P_002650 [bacterium]|jgi:hypothetical protein
MNYIKTKDLNTVILQNLSSRHRDHSPKAYISKPDVFCLGTLYNQVVAATTRKAKQSSHYQANIKMFVESNSINYTLKRDKKSLFPHSFALKCRNKIVKRNQS